MNNIPTVFREAIEEIKSVSVEIMECIIKLNKALCFQEKEIKELFDGGNELLSAMQLMNEKMQLMNEKPDKIIGENSDGYT